MKIHTYSFLLLFLVLSCISNDDAKQNDISSHINPGATDNITELASNIDSIAVSNGPVSFLSKDKEIFDSIIQHTDQMGSPLNQIIISTGQCFFNRPYVGFTLESDSIEHLIVNLREFDCTTFLTSVLAISRCIHHNKTTLTDYCTMLQQIRYRGGIINYYPSRLHYFSDWIYDNQNMGIINDITQSIGGEPWHKNIDFMTTHISYYKKLADSSFVQKIIEQENEINQREYFYIPKNKVESIEHQIKDGDIIAITSGMKGLDIAHVGYAIHQQNRIYLFHASSSGKRVMISEKPLHNYLQGIKKHTGIMVLRANNK